MTWGECVGAAGYPVGCQIGRLTRHETPLRLARPSQATKISKPNRFAYPFRSRPRGVRGAPILNLRPHQAPSYRDTSTANLGLGVTPRRGPCSKIPSTLSSRRITHLQSLAPEDAFKLGVQLLRPSQCTLKTTSLVWWLGGGWLVGAGV